MNKGKQEENSKKESGEEFYADTMEIEKKRTKAWDFNAEKGVLVREFSDGLNQNRGVFANTAVFVTNQGEAGDENTF